MLIFNNTKLMKRLYQIIMWIAEIEMTFDNYAMMRIMKK